MTRHTSVIVAAAICALQASGIPVVAVERRRERDWEDELPARYTPPKSNKPAQVQGAREMARRRKQMERRKP